MSFELTRIVSLYFLGLTGKRIDLNTPTNNVTARYSHRLASAAMVTSIMVKTQNSNLNGLLDLSIFPHWLARMPKKAKFKQ